MIGNKYLRIIIWLIITFGIFGNSFVILIKIKNFKRSSDYFYIGLSFSDFFLDIYLIIIGIVDQFYHKVYIDYDYRWRFSYLCKFCGVFASVALLFSNICLLFITIDRYFAVCYPLKHLQISYKLISLKLFLLFIYVTFLAILPIFVFKVDFYFIFFFCFFIQQKIIRKIILKKIFFFFLNSRIFIQDHQFVLLYISLKK